MADAPPFAAVIFDMDGVLVDSEPLYYAAVSAVLAEDGIAFPLDQYKRYMGTKASWPEFVEDLGLPRPASHYRERSNELVTDGYRSVDTPLPGVVELVRGLRDLGLPLAVASSSRRDWVETCLDRLGIADAFDVIVSGSDISQGKPAPDIYLRAAGLLGLLPRQCLAIEDAPAGIEAAHAAGMTCWAVRTEFSRGLALPDPERTLESLEEVDLADIAGVAADMAAGIAGNSWHTLRADKRLVNEGHNYTPAEGLAFERRTSPGAGPELAERLARFRNKS